MFNENSNGDKENNCDNYNSIGHSFYLKRSSSFFRISSLLEAPEVAEPSPREK